MNPYLPPGAIVRQLFVTEPFYDTIAVVNLTVFGTALPGLWPRVGHPDQLASAQPFG
jgi:hypothetical protein